MKLFSDDEFLVYKTRLKSDIYWISYWYLNFRGKPDCIGQFIKIGRSDPMPLKSPLLLIRFEKIEGIYSKREVANFINDEVEKKRIYMTRVGERLAKEVEHVVLMKKNSHNPRDQPSTIANRLRGIKRRLLLLITFLLSGDGNTGNEGDKNDSC